MFSYSRWYLVWICLTSPAPAQVASLELIEAVRSALERNPQLESQRAFVQIAEGARQFETGAFDPVIRSALESSFSMIAPLIPGDPARIGPGTSRFSQTAFSGGANKLYRSGVTLSPTYELSRFSSPLYPSGYSSTIVGVAVSIPLLRGRGTAVVAARERAALIEVRASQFDLDFAIANIVRTAGNAYWSLVAAYRNLAVTRAAEERGQIYVDNTQALIDADHVPRTDLNQVTGNLARRRAQRISAEVSIVAARQSLAFAMGRTAEEITTALPEPADDFPAAPANVLPSDSPQSLGQNLASALAQRADYLAALTRREGAEVLLPAAENALLPNLNLTASTGYQGLRGGGSLADFLASPVSGLRGPSLIGGISFSVPINRNAAFGALRQVRAGIVQADALARDTARAISQGTTVAVANVRGAIQRVQATRLAVETQTEALDGAREKYNAGLGSVVEILQNEDNLNSALADEVQARFEYALALIQYRFAVGTLVPANQPVPLVQRAAFFDPIPATQP